MRGSNSFMSMSSRFQKMAPSPETWMVAMSGGGVPGGGGGAATGRSTGMDLSAFSERVNSTKVASRKKMTSMRGMISMRAFLRTGTLILVPSMRVQLYCYYGRAGGLLGQGG